MEMSVVLVIIACVVGSGLALGKAAMDQAKVVITNNRLDAIETALMAFRQANNRLPCPSDITVAKSDTDFGVEAANLGTCISGSPEANYNVKASKGGKNVEGGVPVRALRLTDEFAFDAWGNKIAYGVWAPLTGTNAFLDYGIDKNCGALNILATTGTLRSTDGDYVLVSHGPNRHGGVNNAGTAYNAGSTNADELVNCHCTSSAGADTYKATYVQKKLTQDSTNANNTFDDYVRFKERWQLQNEQDENQPAGNIDCGVRGFVVSGEGVSTIGYAGTVHIETADVNNDGIADMIIGAFISNSQKGAVFVVFGSRNGFDNPLLLDDLDGTDGFRINGIAASDWTGYHVASGDINGDGIADIIISAEQADPGGRSAAGSVYVLFGGKGEQPTGTAPWPAVIELSDLDGTNGFRMDGTTAGDQLGTAIAAGDINGDGKTDLLMGAYGRNSNDGAIYVLFGGSGPKTGASTWSANWTSPPALASLNGTNGFRVDGRTGAAEKLGNQGLLAANINGSADGIPDLIMGANSADNSSRINSGSVYVIFGKTSAWSSSFAVNTVATPATGFQIDGEIAGNLIGAYMSAGDINGDNIPDLVMGAADTNGTNNGKQYILFGKTTAWANTDLANINGTNGFKFADTVSMGQMFRNAVGDINRDGFADLITGASGASGHDKAFVLFGGKGEKPNNEAPWPTELTIDDLDGTNGFELDGTGVTSGAYFGYGVGAGDINGDGKPDLIAAGSGQNLIYVYFGQRGVTTWIDPYDVTDLE